MVYLEVKHQRIIKGILANFPHKFYAFGSRVVGTHKPFSDLDICCMNDLSDSEKSRLVSAFEESDLPFKIDLIEWNKISTTFQKIIQKDLTEL